MNRSLRYCFLSFLLFCFLVNGLFVGCGAGEGELQLTVWGEEFVENKIPASEVADGWEITFTQFLIVIGQVKLATQSGLKGPVVSGSKVFDLKQKGAQIFGSSAVMAATWDSLTYEVVPADQNTVAGNANADGLKRMKDNGYSIYLEGKATKGSVTKTFKWGFKTQTTYSGCKSKAVVQTGGKATAQFTIHADHFFYDDLESDDAKVRFDAIAQADQDNNNEVTLQELTAFGGKDFAGLANYGVGRFSDVKDLGAFVTHLSRTLGHIDGEGHCNVNY